MCSRISRTAPASSCTGTALTVASCSRVMSSRSARVAEAALRAHFDEAVAREQGQGLAQRMGAAAMAPALLLDLELGVGRQDAEGCVAPHRSASNRATVAASSFSHPTIFLQENRKRSTFFLLRHSCDKSSLALLQEPPCQPLLSSPREPG